MPAEDNPHNPLHSECAVMTMVSVQARNLFNDILCLAYHDIVTERLPHSPLIRWADYSTMKDRQDGFRLDYSFMPINESSYRTAVQVRTYWRTMPDASDYVPV